MPQIVQVPGKGDVEFPDNMSATDIEAAIKANMAEQPQVQGEEAPLAAQVGRGMMDVYQGAKQEVLNLGASIRPALDALTNKIDSHVDEMSTPGSMENKAAKSLLGSFYELATEPEVRQAAKDYNAELSAELREYNANNPDFQVGRVLGSLATPLTLMPGAGARTIGGKIAAGVGTGTIASQFMPVDTTDNPDEFWAQKGEQALWGAGIGGSIPVAGKLVGVVGGWLDELTKPLSKNGIYRDVSKFLKETFDENKGRVETAIRRAIDSGDDRTVGQILADASRTSSDDFGAKLVRLEKDLAKRSESLRSLYDLQRNTRTEALDFMAKTPKHLEALIAKRAGNSKALYDKAWEVKVKPDNELLSILDNKFGRAAISTANEVADAMKIPRTNISRMAHFIKLKLDKELTKSGDDSLDNASRKAVQGVKEDLVGWLEKRNPAYKDARTQYMKDSFPIDQMKVAQEFKTTYQNALGADSPSTYVRSLRDSHKIIKKTGGDPRFNSMDDLFSKEEMGVFNKIADELKVEGKAKQMAGRVESSFKDLKGEIEIQLPRILERNIVIANSVLKRFGQDKTPEYQKLLSDLVSNPKEFIKAYGGHASKEKQRMALDILRRLNTVTASQQGAKDLGE